MGRQVGFFNFPADLAPLEALLSDSEFAVMRDSSPAPEPVVVPTLRPDSDGYGRKLLIVRRTDLPELRWRHIKSRNVWMVDDNSSPPTIEYFPGYNPEGQPPLTFSRHLINGRMWFQTSRWEDNELVRVDPDFAARADRLFRWIKKHWILIECNYFSPAAAALWHATWQGVFDEPYSDTDRDQLSRWRDRNQSHWPRQNDPDDRLPPDNVHVAISNATRGQPRRLTISIRTSTTP